LPSLPQARLVAQPGRGFFSILARRLLRHGAFSDPEDLAAQMLAFVEHYNLTAQPFNWTYTGKVLNT
jgi:hypothetical protein